MNIRDFIGVVRELSFTDIRQEAMIPPRILLIAPDSEMGENWRSIIFGEEAATFVDVATLQSIDVDPLSFDALVSVGPLDPGIARRWSDLFRRASEEMRLIEIDPGEPANPERLEALRRVMCDLCRDRSVAFGRYIDVMRSAATAEIIADTSRVNAQFAALSNIPAIIPLVGGIFAAGADFLVLTKNQLMMMYRLAAIYDRDLDDRWRIYSELAPVVGAGFLWRTTARQIAALLPFALGAVPKVAIAFVGTYSVGHAARLYYECGIQLSPDELSRLYQEGLAVLGSARERLPGFAETEARASAAGVPSTGK